MTAQTIIARDLPGIRAEIAQEVPGLPIAYPTTANQQSASAAGAPVRLTEAR